MEKTLTDANFDQEIAAYEKPVVVDFFATWCGPCEVLGPVLEKVAESFGDKVVLAKVNVDQFPATSGKFNIDRIPNVILFKDGKPVDSFIGLMPEPTIKTWLENALNKK